jgi:glycosyltransferase involved in cell wall biosynthesis
VIAGGASLLDHSEHRRAFDALAASAGLMPGPRQDVVLTGALPDSDMPALFRCADALLMPSLREGFGLVVLEALACGTPVVVSQRAPFTEYLADTVAAGHAIYADPLDAVSIAAAMRQAIEPERAAALARATPPVCRRYSWAASAAHHVALYRAERALARAEALTH